MFSMCLHAFRGAVRMRKRRLRKKCSNGRWMEVFCTFRLYGSGEFEHGRGDCKAAAYHGGSRQTICGAAFDIKYQIRSDTPDCRFSEIASLVRRPSIDRLRRCLFGLSKASISAVGNARRRFGTCRACRGCSNRLIPGRNEYAWPIYGHNQYRPFLLRVHKLPQTARRRFIVTLNSMAVGLTESCGRRLT